MENNEMMDRMIEEAVAENIPTAQAIAEEVIAPAAQEIVQEMPTIDADAFIPTTKAKHSGLKTILLISGLAGIVLYKPVKKAIGKRQEKKKAELQAMIDATVDKKVQEYFAGQTTAQPAAESNAADGQNIEETKEDNKEKK